jgi:hypothetical protein
MGYGSYVAACAEVSVNNKGVVKIHRRIISATDPATPSTPRRSSGRSAARINIPTDFRKASLV